MKVVTGNDGRVFISVVEIRLCSLYGNTKFSCAYKGKGHLCTVLARANGLKLDQSGTGNCRTMHLHYSPENVKEVMYGDR